MALTLTSQQRAKLRGLAHALKPVVIIGHNGLRANVLAEADAALLAHELIKVKIAHGDREIRQQLSEQLCQELDATWVQSIGQLVVLYRPQPRD